MKYKAKILQDNKEEEEIEPMTPNNFQKSEEVRNG